MEHEGHHKILHKLLSPLMRQTFAQNMSCDAFTDSPHALHLPLHFQKPLTSSNFPRPVISKRKDDAND